MNESQTISLLRQLVSTPSPSRCEAEVADIIGAALLCEGIVARRFRNNIWAVNRDFRPGKPILMLNSHLDTVRPVASWTRNPFAGEIVDDRLYGLGSNDAGASVVSLLRTFVEIYSARLPFNTILALTAEEEVMGENGMRAFIPMLSEKGLVPDMAIVGEPTGMQPAIAERGLVVIDAVTVGKSGHAARREGINAIYLATDAMLRVREHRFEKCSGILGPIGCAITMMTAGTQHNVVPDTCSWVIDVRTTDACSNEEVVKELQAVVGEATTLTPRSTHIRASVIAPEHLLVRAAVEAGGTPYVSPTTSDMALMPEFPTMKIGPGCSSRSHKADEYIRLTELRDAHRDYIRIIDYLKDNIDWL